MYETIIIPSILLCIPYGSLGFINSRRLDQSFQNYHTLLSSNSSPSPTSSSSSDDDWVQAELTLLNFPSKPNPSLSPEEIAISICRSLQFVDHPTPSAGLERIFPFLTWECRKHITARQGGDTIERFCEYGLFSPALQPFMGAKKIDLGEGTLTPATNTRGDLLSYKVTIHGADILKLQHSSGIVRNGVAMDAPQWDIVMRMEKMRRPPLAGCWLVKEMLDVRHAFAGDMGNVHVGG